MFFGEKNTFSVWDLFDTSKNVTFNCQNSYSVIKCLISQAGNKSFSVFAHCLIVVGGS